MPEVIITLHSLGNCGIFFDAYDINFLLFSKRIMIIISKENFNFPHCPYIYPVHNHQSLDPVKLL